MTNTPKLQLPQLSSSQSQKHVTVNSDLRILDALVRTTVINLTTSTPPVSPSDGDTYIVGTSGTGVWSGYDNYIAYYNSTAWTLFAPTTGWIIYDTATSSMYQWSGSAWSPYPYIGKRVSGSDFSVTSSVVLVNVTGLVSPTLPAATTWAFEAIVYTTSNVAGGVQFAVNASSAPTALIAEAIVNNAAAISAQTRTTTNGAAIGAVTAVTVALARITGTVTMNAAGTIAIQFAQNASNGTASKVLVGSTLVLRKII